MQVCTGIVADTLTIFAVRNALSGFADAIVFAGDVALSAILLVNL